MFYSIPGKAYTKTKNGEEDYLFHEIEFSQIHKNIRTGLIKDKRYTPSTECIQSINHNHNHNHNKSYKEDKKFKLIGNTIVEL